MCILEYLKWFYSRFNPSTHKELNNKYMPQITLISQINMHTCVQISFKKQLKAA